MSEIEKALLDLSQKLDDINKKIDDNGLIKIRNGGGRQIIYNREVFFQMIYDRVTLKGWMPKIVTFASFLLTILTIVQVFMFLHGVKQ